MLFSSPCFDSMHGCQVRWYYHDHLLVAVSKRLPGRWAAFLEGLAVTELVRKSL
jgi:hypothetical protein